jgi:hypothetical protein
MTELKAAGELAKLEEAHRTGDGARTLEEKRQIAEAQAKGRKVVPLNG